MDSIVEETGDDETIIADNSDPSHKLYDGVAYLQLRVEVEKSKKGTQTMRTKLQEVFKFIQDADDSAALSIFKTDPTPNSEGLHPAPHNKILSTPAKFPDSITSLSKYFMGCRPNSDGGTIWAQIRLLHSEPIENIIADTQADLKEMAANISIQSIQHWDVAQIGFLKNLHPDVDGEVMEEYLILALRDLAPKKDLTLGLKVKSPFDGKKRDKNKTIKFKDRIQAYHVDTVGSMKTDVTRLLKQIFKGQDFRNQYDCEVRLIPLYDRRSSSYTQEKIKRCILQHSQWCKCVVSLPVEGLDSIDTYNDALEGTLRQLILSLPDSHFINIDYNWSRTNFQILYPIKYAETAKDRIAHLGAYLYREYGDRLLGSLTTDMQRTISETKWDEKTNRPVSMLDQELDDILAEDDDIDYVDMSLITDLTVNGGSAIFQPTMAGTAPVPFVPVQDDTSISTFGTTLSKSPRSKKKTPRLTDDSDDDDTILTDRTDGSMHSRVSVVEDTCIEIKQMLKQFIAQGVTQQTATQPSDSINVAESSKGDSAAGV